MRRQYKNRENFQEKLLQISNLSIMIRDHILLNNLSFSLYPGEILGIVGESGSGKTITARAIAGLLADNFTVKADSLLFKGQDLRKMSGQERRIFNGRNLGLIPQKTSNYLHPLLKIREQLIDSYCYYDKGSRREALTRARKLLERFAFKDPERVLKSYPWELSGGMRQRVNIAIAMMNDPQLIIADEPTSGLDTTTGKQVTAFLQEINQQMGCSIIYISHNLAMVKKFCHRVAVLYAGNLMELASSEEIFKNPAHPYTKALLEVIPDLTIDNSRSLPEIRGFVPEEGREGPGCIFINRCDRSTEECRGIPPLQVNEQHCYYCFHPYNSERMEEKEG